MIGEELFISVPGQAEVFFEACVVGAVIAVCYEVFRFFRCLIRHREAFVALEDVLFCTAAAVLSFHFWLCSSRGAVRAFIIAGELTGASVYFLTAGRVFLKAERAFAGMIRKRLEPLLKAFENNRRGIKMHVKRFGFTESKNAFSCLKESVKVKRRLKGLLRRKKEKINLLNLLKRGGSM